MARALFALVVVTAVLFAATSYVEAKPEITLTYFASRGRAEAVRVLLKYLDLEFTDVQYVQLCMPQSLCCAFLSPAHT